MRAGGENHPPGWHPRREPAFFFVGIRRGTAAKEIFYERDAHPELLRIAENEKDCPNFNRLREQEKSHPVESVGKELRDKMSWLKPGQQKTEP